MRPLPTQQPPAAQLRRDFLLCQRLGLCCSHTASRHRSALRVAASTAPQQQQQQQQPAQDDFEYMQLDLPPPLNATIRKSLFVKSSTRVADCPPDRLPEFAVIGRSNVGKSSLLNSLTANSRLARVSKEPGVCTQLRGGVYGPPWRLKAEAETAVPPKLLLFVTFTGLTRLINHFLINDQWYLVDLPGYGWVAGDPWGRTHVSGQQACTAGRQRGIRLMAHWAGLIASPMATRTGPHPFQRVPDWHDVPPSPPRPHQSNPFRHPPHRPLPCARARRFARAGKESRKEWLEFTKDYFVSRDNLVSVLLLVDSSVEPQPVDLACATWLADCEVPFAIVFTKIDNRKKGGSANANADNIRAFKKALAADWEALPRCFETSSKTGQGRSDLLGYLASLRELHVRSTA